MYFSAVIVLLSYYTHTHAERRKRSCRLESHENQQQPLFQNGRNSRNSCRPPSSSCIAPAAAARLAVAAGVGRSIAIVRRLPSQQLRAPTAALRRQRQGAVTAGVKRRQELPSSNSSSTSGDTAAADAAATEGRIAAAGRGYPSAAGRSSSRQQKQTLESNTALRSSE